MNSEIKKREYLGSKKKNKLTRVEKVISYFELGF